MLRRSRLCSGTGSLRNPEETGCTRSTEVLRENGANICGTQLARGCAGLSIEPLAASLNSAKGELLRWDTAFHSFLSVGKPGLAFAHSMEIRRKPTADRLPNLRRHSPEQFRKRPNPTRGMAANRDGRRRCACRPAISCGSCAHN
jgi:hypothetical protein